MIGILSIAVGCAAATRSATSAASVYPSAGFGRVGCFAGPSLEQFYNGPLERNDSTARAGPWLVLDSLSADEADALALPKHDASRPLLHGTIIFADDSLATIVGAWQRPTADSVVLAEHQSHPPVVWRLRQSRRGLVGDAALRSDLVQVLPNGKRVSASHYWSVDLMRVSCALVPRNRPASPLLPVHLREQSPQRTHVGI